MRRDQSSIDEDACQCTDRGVFHGPLRKCCRPFRIRLTDSGSDCRRVEWKGGNPAGSGHILLSKPAPRPHRPGLWGPACLGRGCTAADVRTPSPASGLTGHCFHPLEGRNFHDIRPPGTKFYFYCMQLIALEKSIAIFRVSLHALRRGLGTCAPWMRSLLRSTVVLRLRILPAGLPDSGRHPGASARAPAMTAPQIDERPHGVTP